MSTHGASSQSYGEHAYVVEEVLPAEWRARALSLERGWVLTSALVALLLGVFILIRPDIGVATVGVIFGIFLIVAGVSRLSFGIANQQASTGYRWLSAILGVVVAIGGFYCLLNTTASLEVFAFLLGAGLVVSGIADFANVRGEEQGRPTWLRVVSGLLSVIAGLVMFVVPVISIGLIVVVSAIALIIAGIGGLISLPQLAKN